METLDDVDKHARMKESSDFGQSARVSTPSAPTHLALGADELTLCVACVVEGKPRLYFFDVRAFANGGSDAKPFTEVRAHIPPGVTLSELCFNPVLPSMATAVYSDGSLALYMLSTDDPSKEPDCATLPPAEGVRCVSWSPKGKQLVAGRKDGSLTQYKPDLKEAKTYRPPPGLKLSAVSVLWVSTYQFAVAYEDTSDPEGRPGLHLVQGSKAGATTFTNYDDVCYSTGERNGPQFAMCNLGDWGAVLCASANAMEVRKIECFSYVQFI